MRPPICLFVLFCVFGVFFCGCACISFLVWQGFPLPPACLMDPSCISFLVWRDFPLYLREFRRKHLGAKALHCQHPTIKLYNPAKGQSRLRSIPQRARVVSDQSRKGPEPRMWLFFLNGMDCQIVCFQSLYLLLKLLFSKMTLSWATLNTSFLQRGLRFLQIDIDSCR